MKFKRLIAICAAICVFCTASVTFAVEEYLTRGKVADMLLCAADDYNASVVRSDIIKGYEDGSLCEEKLVTRAEALVMLRRAFGTLPECTGHNARTALKSEDFTDIPLWAQKEIKDVFDSGIAGGIGNGLFSPDEFVTKRQMELFLQRVYALFSTNLKDDFYAAVNKEILESLDLSHGNVVGGPIYELQSIVSARINDIVTDALNPNSKNTDAKQKIADFYSCIVDVEKRDKMGVKPLEKYLSQIENAKTISELASIRNTLKKELCTDVFLGFSLAVDMKDSEAYILSFCTMKPLMNKEVYFENSDVQRRYKEYIEALLSLGGEGSEQAKENAQVFFEFEKKLAERMLDTCDAQNIDAVYNIFTYNKLIAMFPDFDMEEVLKADGLEKKDKILVEDTALTQCFAQLFNQSNFNALKTAAKVAILDAWGETLTSDFSREQYLLDKEITGREEMYTPKQQALLALQEEMPDYLGVMYAEKYFDNDTKMYIENMAKDIKNVFKSRIENLSWMSESAKKTAIKKLDTMRIKVGYNETVATYLDNVKILSPKEGGTFFSNLLNIKKERSKSLALLQNTVPNRDLWDIYPYTVNACYNAANNDITVPAAIVQKPLYDKNNSYEENLGGIGYVIAHEICHAFDNVGAHFDENGNAGNWWSSEDYTAFEKLCSALEEFYEGEEAIAAIPTSGRLTLGENVADLGGALCITQLAADKKDFDYKLLYTSMARTLACTKTREFALLQSKTDTHADEKLRINKVLMNISEFYDAFDISEGDAMYIAPQERIKMW